jgi:hypothetical protein
VKVRCVRLYGNDGTEMRSSPWMKVGRVYDVLEVSIYQNGDAKLRIVGDQPGTPALFSPKGLEIVDHSLPRNWEVHIANGIFYFGPAALNEPGFWERFFNQDPVALQTFEKVRVDSIIESNMS